MNDTRDAALERLLGEAGFAAATRVPLAGDASTRRYERLIRADGVHAILMDAPRSAETGPCPPDATDAERLALGWNATSRLAASRVEAFVAVAKHLRGIGLSAPEILAADAAAGYAIVEDLGDDLFARVIPDRADETTLYAAAGHTLAQAQAAPVPTALEGAGVVWPLLAFDALALRVNADLFAEWLPQASDVRFSDAAAARFEAARDGLIAQALSFPRAFTIRDYHAENLIWLPQRGEARSVGLLDFQDAVCGFRGWDLSMLLHDARRDVSPAAAAAALDAYLRASGAEERAIRAEIAVLGALNVMRILGLFARLAVRDAKPRYLAFMPRMWAHLRGALAAPETAEMRALVDEVAGPYLHQEAA
jgi:hypothetical protein